jgi:hypothetical protein
VTPDALLERASRSRRVLEVLLGAEREFRTIIETDRLLMDSCRQVIQIRKLLERRIQEFESAAQACAVSDGATAQASDGGEPDGEVRDRLVLTFAAHEAGHWVTWYSLGATQITCTPTFHLDGRLDAVWTSGSGSSENRFAFSGVCWSGIIAECLLGHKGAGMVDAPELSEQNLKAWLAFVRSKPTEVLSASDLAGIQVLDANGPAAFALLRLSSQRGRALLSKKFQELARFLSAAQTARISAVCSVDRPLPEPPVLVWSR